MQHCRAALRTRGGCPRPCEGWAAAAPAPHPRGVAELAQHAAHRPEAQSALEAAGLLAEGAEEDLHLRHVLDNLRGASGR